jgi:6-phosphogluconolactonase/glucosamine-6-phosphate isomerase/deaminase
MRYYTKKTGAVMEIIITPNYEEMSKTAAKIIASEIRRKHDSGSWDGDR